MIWTSMEWQVGGGELDVARLHRGKYVLTLSPSFDSSSRGINIGSLTKRKKQRENERINH